MIGTIVGSYRILDCIAVGGMGTVYRAEHTLIGKIAALKVLHPEMSGNREIVGRFFNEAKATTTIKHPGIVEIFDFGYMPSGHAFLVMEFLEGEPLSQRMRSRGPMTEGEAAMLMRGVCSALAAAHAKGIVHRDLKPDNIFVVPDPDGPLGERTKVLDFGIAKLTDIGLAGTTTKTGAVMGTPTYMSPEQCRGSGNVDHRADLYSIGCILYELVTGRPPFVNTGAGELIGSHLFVEPEPPSRHAQVSPELEALVMSLLNKRPEQRVQTALDLAQHLIALAQQHGWIAVSSTDPASRMSMQSIVPPGGVTIGAMISRPMITPAFPTPHASHLAYVAQGATELMSPSRHDATPIPQTPKPTTLSGAASETHPAVAPRKGLIIGGAFVAAVGAGIALLIALSGGAPSSEDTTVPAKAPVATDSTPDPIPTATEPTPDPTPIPTTTTTPTGTATATTPTTPAGTATATTPSGTASATTPTTPTGTATTTTPQTPTGTATATTPQTPNGTATATTPTTTKVTKPTKPTGTATKPTKPTGKPTTPITPTTPTTPTKPTRPTKPDKPDLLETDL